MDNYSVLRKHAYVLIVDQPTYKRYQLKKGPKEHNILWEVKTMCLYSVKAANDDTVFHYYTGDISPTAKELDILIKLLTAG